ncbi:thioredoxin domain-containing protein [Nocardioides limicola]|uniref:thioredoxin domain-containing protein n=1 Tax=Nocardioides limicola TaxID=2803368 RepID=UPI00193B28A6|nr:thioredoxin domain-containing protein [Nocardioides sp. DJM-14]
MGNRLQHSTSPYLQQHAENPVDWWEWGTEAFDEARRRDVPVLLSVGYAACHWCHVMAHESFEDQATADYLNEHFVSIKVDREERPDIDAVYMGATQAMTGQGGWPMTVVLDHDGGPFFAGTYFPDQPRHGQPSFRQVLEALVDAWTNRGDDVRRVAGQLRDHLQATASLAGGAVDAEAISAAVDLLADEFDERSAGFGGAPKFPPSMLMPFLLRHAQRVGTSPGTSGARARTMATRTLTAMASGGIHDQLGGGFARYSVDSGWVVPHFEKMLYDNALLLTAYAEWSLTADGVELGAEVVRGIAEFLLNELQTDEGGFASALDADSDGAEGTFYVWTRAQLDEVLGESDGAWAAELFEVTGSGTFEHGTSTLQRTRAIDDPNRFARVRQRLLDARAKRTRPARDDKVVAAWNGLAISGLVTAGLALDEPEWIDAARGAAELLWRIHLVEADTEARLLRTSRDGAAGAAVGILEDYACVADGFLALAAATADPRWLERAGLLLDTVLARFVAEDGGFHDTADDAETLIARPRDPSDNASPSGHAAAVRALLSHAALTGSGVHRGAAERALAAGAQLIERAPRFAGWSLVSAEELLAGPVEIAVVGRPGHARDALEGAALRRLGARVVVADRSVAGIGLLEGRAEVDGQPAAYVCRGHVCDRPVVDAAEIGLAQS